MLLRGSRIHIIGSASRDKVDEDFKKNLAYAHSLVREAVPVLLEHGATFILGELEESKPIKHGMDVVFDWTVLKAIEAYAQQHPDAAPEPLAKVIVEEKQITWCETEPDSEKRDRWRRMRDSRLISLDPYSNKLYKPDLYEKRLEASDVVIVLGGGAGAGIFVGRAKALRKNVVPIDLELLPRNEITPPEGQGMSLAREIRRSGTKQEQYFRFTEGKRSRSMGDFIGLSVSEYPDPAVWARQRLCEFLKNLYSGKQVFIGHGKSKVWIQLEKFLKTELHLEEVREFEDKPSAGHLTPDRIKEMLDNAAFAFLIMTGDVTYDEDRSKHARENVIHEIGLFQAKLGINKAIVMLEDGCSLFSNIRGVQYIPFPKEDMDQNALDRVRQVLISERII